MNSSSNCPLEIRFPKSTGSCYKSTPIYAYWYATCHMPFYFLPHDYSYDLIFLISLSMLIITISYLYSDGILSDLHHSLRRHTPYCSYLFHTHSDLCQSLLNHTLTPSYDYHWLIRYFSHSYVFRLDDSLSCYHMDAYLTMLVTVYLLCI